MKDITNLSLTRHVPDRLDVCTIRLDSKDSAKGSVSVTMNLSCGGYHAPFDTSKKMIDGGRCRHMYSLQF